MKIGITINKKSYTPEAYAYEKYLNNHGISTQLDVEENLSQNNDLNIYFLGKKTNKSKNPEIHEYQSLSTPPFSKGKDFIKKTINCKPEGRIFLNEIVEYNLKFNDSIPKIYRDMGVDEPFFKIKEEEKQFDVVYCGSIESRKGLIECIKNLSSIGLRLCIIGDIKNETIINNNLKNKNIHFTGRIKRDEIPFYYSISESGLNFTPDLFPYNLQTSTKTLEYLASGLKCISNTYEWSQMIEKKLGTKFIDLQKIKSPEDIWNFKSTKVNMENYKWDNILEKSNFLYFIKTIANT